MNLFTFELLVHFVESLSIAHGDEKSLGKYAFCLIMITNILAAL